jgi:hypothetical protein
MRRMVQVRLLMDLLDEEAAVRQGQAHSAHRNSLPNAPHGHFAETIKANSDCTPSSRRRCQRCCARVGASCQFRLRVLDGTASARMDAAVSAAS